MQDMRYPKVILRVAFGLCAVLLAWLAPACGDFDTDVVGTAFRPLNNQVRQFTHLVYVEYTPTGVRVWGPAAKEVSAHVEGCHTTIALSGDSLVLFAYGYPSADTLRQVDASLTVEHGIHPYALYLSGLQLYATSRPAVCSRGQGDTHVVLPPGSSNVLSSRVAPSADAVACLQVDGAVTLSGTGALQVLAVGQPSLHALQAEGGLRCAHGVEVTLRSQSADGIHLTGGSMRSSLGKWTFDAGRHAICADADSIVLTAGSYGGTAATGAFFQAPMGTIYRQADITALAAQPSAFQPMADDADSLFALLQVAVDTLTFQADSTYAVVRNTQRSQLTTFTPSRTVPDASLGHATAWFSISSAQVQPTDTLYFQ